MAILDPFADPTPAEVPLAAAPLIRVIAQVRFPLVTAIEQLEFIAPFQEAIRATYPILRQEQTQQLVLGGSMAPAMRPSTAWRFSSEDAHWRVSLTSDFLALETTRYTSRNDFLGRFEVVVAALVAQVDPKLIDRVGVRFIDRISGDDLDRIGKFIRPEVRGLSGGPAATWVSHSITETVFSRDEVQALVRWGQLPPRVTVDPAAIEPSESPSWILDLDMFSLKPAPFSVERVVTDTRHYMERLYTFFRWVVTDDFLRHYGAQ